MLVVAPHSLVVPRGGHSARRLHDTYGHTATWDFVFFKHLVPSAQTSELTEGRFQLGFWSSGFRATEKK